MNKNFFLGEVQSNKIFISGESILCFPQDFMFVRISFENLILKVEEEWEIVANSLQ